MIRVVPILVLLAGCWRNAPEPAVETAPSKPPLELHVTAWKWACQIAYPGGMTDSDLHVPAGRTVRLFLTSRDIDHEVELAAAGVDVHAVPGRTATVELRFPRPGRLAWKCPVDTPPGGQPLGFASSQVFVDPPDAFETYIHRFDAELHPKTLADRIALGAKLYERKGCNACHTIDGTPRIGPSLKGMFGSTITLANGAQRTIDEAAIRDALRAPVTFARPGYPPVMPSFDGQLTPVQADALVDYIRSLSAP